MLYPQEFATPLTPKAKKIVGLLTKCRRSIERACKFATLHAFHSTRNGIPCTFAPSAWSARTKLGLMSRRADFEQSDSRRRAMKIAAKGKKDEGTATKDHQAASVNAVVYFRVIDPLKAILEVENYLYATSELSQTTLRSILGQAELDELLAERERINRRLQEVIDQQTDPWGIKVSLVEVKHVDLPDTMKRAMARQAESERERRAKVIHAEGEFQAAAKLRDAAETIKGYPMAMQMRFLQTLADVGTENNTTIVFPVPIELFSTLLSNGRYSRREPDEPEHASFGPPVRK
jgi:hypothetical protein